MLCPIIIEVFYLLGHGRFCLSAIIIFATLFSVPCFILCYYHSIHLPGIGISMEVSGGSMAGKSLGSCKNNDFSDW